MSAPPRVAIDAVELTGPGGASGIGTYIRNLLGGLAGIPEISVDALVTPGAFLPTGINPLRTHRLFRRWRTSVWEHEIRRTADRRMWSGDVFHNPVPHAPLFHPRPWVQTLHDLIPIVFEDPALAVLKHRFERFAPRYAKADAVIAVSRHAADQGIRLLGIDPDRVHVVYHGVDPHFSPDHETGQETSPPYISFVSQITQRKGAAEAFGVIASLADAGYPHHLKVVGSVPYRAQAGFRGLTQACSHPERLDIQGYVPDVAPVYRGASVHLITSRYEGFGLTALEAMACGTPVVAFDNSSLTEVVGPAGILVPDGDVVEATRAVRKILDSPALQRELRERGLEHAARFTWSGTARGHADVYRQVA